MMQLLKLSLSLVALAILTACQSLQTSDFEIITRLPASGDCYGLRVMSGKTTRYPEEQCIEIVKRAIILTSENYEMLRGDVLKNCQYTQCQQITGAADGLFLSLDKALQKIPTP